ncbi:hypothetical protein LCGC14_0495100 [marine sediment metagenome]|uniref:Uncharacterized protein n=1 Tax=marine sediment metagenome TaxID=412755 RepID=A0A0F9VE50_9ZZZZ
MSFEIEVNISVYCQTEGCNEKEMEKNDYIDNDDNEANLICSICGNAVKVTL